MSKAARIYPSIDALTDELKANDPPRRSTTEFEWVHGSKGGMKILSTSDGGRFLYRGQIQRWPTCMAQVWRAGQPTADKKLNWILSRTRIAELELMLAKHPLLEIARENSIEVDYDALAQHYEIPTFWLDITSSIDVASFFAVTKFDADGSKSPLRIRRWRDLPNQSIWRRAVRTPLQIDQPFASEPAGAATWMVNRRQRRSEFRQPAVCRGVRICPYKEQFGGDPKCDGRAAVPARLNRGPCSNAQAMPGRDNEGSQICAGA